MKKIKYSVIIPAYNIEKHIPYLVRFANTILEIRNDIEFIIIDDGSIDQTYKLCSKVQNFTVFHQKNCGVSSARNNGITKANGTFILFLDADDEYQLNLFDKLDKNLNEKSEVIIFNYDITNIKNANPNTKAEFYKNEILKMFFLKKMNICICAICFNLTFLKNNNLTFPSGYSFGEDIYFIIKALLATNNNITYIPDKLFRYKIENSSTVRTSINQNKIFVIKLYQELYKEITDLYLRNDLSYFTQRTYIYLIKLSFLHGLDDSMALHQLKLNFNILDGKAEQNKSTSFIITKTIIKKLKYLVFILLSKRIINHTSAKK
ncbi:TPA: glycosyltransferase family 2 protein [Providencia rettgeri]